MILVSLDGFKSIQQKGVWYIIIIIINILSKGIVFLDRM